MDTAFTRLLGCPAPLQLAPVGGGVGTPELAIAVCEAGALGMIHSLDELALSERLARLREGTDGPYGVGFFAFTLPHLMADLELAAETSRVVDVFWGAPDEDVVARIHSGGALAFWQVGSADEALAAADAGCDVVVAQGVEAGGHVRGTTALLDLLDRVVPRVSVPVLAAGGISTHGQLRRALDAGAAGARIGTRLVATQESAAHPDYLAALVLADGPDDTELTTAFHVGWEGAPHRVLRAAIAAASLRKDAARVTYAGRSRQVEQWSALPPTTSCDGDVSGMAMYAGTGVGEIHDIPTVAAVMRLLLDVE